MFAVPKIGNRTPERVKEFILDAPDDVQYLPTQTQKGTQVGQDTVSNEYCATGSSAFIISTAQLFMLNSKGVWCQV